MPRFHEIPQHARDRAHVGASVHVELGNHQALAILFDERRWKKTEAGTIACGSPKLPMGIQTLVHNSSKKKA
jgi:hypothetical protein